MLPTKLSQARCARFTVTFSVKPMKFKKMNEAALKNRASGRLILALKKGRRRIR